uniref:Uncharacterized protein n=1 Tax=Lepeophtheirus salmonis TaxID=72036 RepID=A0A0K2U0I5_LEPSM
MEVSVILQMFFNVKICYFIIHWFK